MLVLCSGTVIVCGTKGREEIQKALDPDNILEHKPKEDYTTASDNAHVEGKLLVVGMANAQCVHDNAIKKEGAGG